jgi:DNA-binding HxlR family transcriptional regulator
MKRLEAKPYDCAAGCPVEATLDLIDGKWKAVILYHLLDDTIRFNELGRRLSRITQRMLTRQLRELEAAGLIHREIYAEVPPRVEYSLTDQGRSLEPVIRALWTWGNQYLAARKSRHDSGEEAPALAQLAALKPKPDLVISRLVRRRA